MTVPSPWEDPVRRLVTAYGKEQPEGEKLGTDEARCWAWSLVCDALHVTEEQLAVETDLLYLASWFFWCRWEILPEGPGRESLETSIRLFSLVVIVDPDGLGSAKHLPKRLRRLIKKKILPEANTVLIDEARSLLDVLADGFDPVAMRLLVVLTEAALVLTPQDDPGRADYLSNLAAAWHTAHRWSKETQHLANAVQACRAAVAAAWGGAYVVPHLVNLAIGLEALYHIRGDPPVLREALCLFDGLRADGRLGSIDPPLRARTLSAYATATFALYKATRDTAQLSLAVDRCRAAVTAEKGAEQQSVYITNLVEMLRERYEAQGGQTDLDEAAGLMEEVVRHTPEGDPELPRRLAVLASVLSAGDATSLDRPVELCEAALRRLDPADAARPAVLTNLSSLLVTRHRHASRPRDLRRGLAAARLALMLAPTDEAVRPEVHSNLGSALAAWYEHTDRPELLDTGIDHIRLALAAPVLGSVRKATLLSNLGAMLFTRAVRLGGDEHLKEAVVVTRSAAELTRPGHLDLSRRLGNLALALEQFFERWGELSALDEAIATHRQACSRAPEEALRSHHVSALATALNVRYWLRGRSGDLLEAVDLHRESIAVLPDSHPDRSRRMGNLASALLNRYGQDGSASDVREAVQQMRAAVRLVPDGHADLPYRLDMLGVALTQLASETGAPHHCNEARDALVKAVGLSTAEDPALEARLRHLGAALELRSHLVGDPTDLDCAVAAFRQAADTCPQDSPDRAVDLHHFGGALAERAKQRTEGGNAEAAADDLHGAADAWREAAATGRAAVMVRLAAAESWARLGLETGELGSAVDAAALAVDLLPRVSWLGVPRADRERLLMEWNGIAGNACAAAIEAGQEGRAAELLDAGRSILWQQLLNLHHDAAELARARPDLATRLRELSVAIRALEEGAQLNQPVALPADGLNVPPAVAGAEGTAAGT
ncbi:hypothetical protein [Streptomyces sp. NPDC005799]|uniref:hypothetical protein n=1 Tax=Streptomyces sp. NPDC005799 TaxID=3154678 RepID=UPI0033F8A4B6